MSNPFAYTELHTQDPATAKKFYQHLFDWKMQDEPTPAGVYTDLDLGGGAHGGLKQATDGTAGSRWLPYVQVPDLAAATARAKALGARAVKELVEIPGAGLYSVIVDPTGAPLGMWQPLPR
jgi:predicted enzyme related to lactoylglutathione lyase